MRSLLALALLAVVAVAAAWLARHPGTVAVDWQGWRIESSAAVALLAVAAVAVAAAVLYRVWVWLRRGRRRMAAGREAERRRQGYRALSRGMVAVAAGDRDESAKLARRAEALLEEPPLTLLLSAQAAQLNGDDTAAARYFEAMLGNPELEFLGLRGLLTGALRAGEDPRALEYARRAYKLRPGTEWIQRTLFELQVTGGEWKQAEALLQDVGRRGAAADDETRRRRAILLLEQGRAADKAGEAPGAARLAARAASVSPGFVPASVAAAELLGRTGKARRAVKVLEAAWSHAPHPDLVAALGSLFPEEDARRRRERVQRIVARNPDHPEARLALARAALDAGDFAAARETLTALGPAPDARGCALWAELEDAEHGPGIAAREWLLRAARAQGSPVWSCRDCGAVAAEWSASCPRCRGFDTQEWAAAPPAAAAAALPPPEPEPEPATPAPAAAPALPPAPPVAAAVEPNPPAPPREQKLRAPPIPDVPAGT